MNIEDNTIQRLCELDEDSAEYQTLLDHVETSADLRRQLDLHCLADDGEFLAELRGLQPDDLHDYSHHSGEPPAPIELAPASHPELLGRLDRYDIECIVGQGGMGVVYKAIDTELNRVVAIKVLAEHLSRSAAARRRFAREAQAAAAVLHPNVIPIYNVADSQQTSYLVMQYVPGQSLQSRVDSTGPISMVDALRIGHQTAAALAAAHDQGLVHRDVKPSNILLESETDRAILSDFGLARTADDASLTQTGIVAGTPHYMSPEQANGSKITPSSDLFALGSMLYFMLSGHPPFRAESAMGVLHCICSKPHRSIQQVNSEVPLEFSRLIDLLLAKKPGRRPASAQAVADKLQDILSRIQQGKIRLTQDRPYGRSRIAIATTAVMLIIISCSAAWQLLVSRDQTKDVNQSRALQSRDNSTNGAPDETPGASTPSVSLSNEDYSWLRAEFDQRVDCFKGLQSLDQQLDQVNRSSQRTALEYSLYYASRQDHQPQVQPLDTKISEIAKRAEALEAIHRNVLSQQ
ncbi:MAG TPA: serine/threonine protein kinase [Planctomycetaceae bacterium]|nr:serine/threonine protein kinase [Planctomycetaceae bacterium]